MPNRDWKAASIKRREGCRICGEWPIQLAHIIGREADKFVALDDGYYDSREPTGARVWRVSPLRVLALCYPHHAEYDAHDLDLLPYLTPEEQAQALLDAGSLEQARIRLCPSAYQNKIGVE